MNVDRLKFCKYCKLPIRQCQCTSGEWSADYKQINIPFEDHQHRWEIDKLAGFIKTGIKGVYIICRSCGEVRLVEVKYV